jgi:hypothetical protein
MFAKRELENEIKGAPTKSKEEKEQMLELLRRFEEEDAKGEENEEEHEEELALRLSSIDLGMSLHIAQFRFDLMINRICFARGDMGNFDTGRTNALYSGIA